MDFIALLFYRLTKKKRKKKGSAGCRASPVFELIRRETRLTDMASWSLQFKRHATVGKRPVGIVV